MLAHLPLALLKMLEKLLGSYSQKVGDNIAFVVKECQDFGLHTCTGFHTSMNSICFFYSAMSAVLDFEYEV